MGWADSGLTTGYTIPGQNIDLIPMKTEFCRPSIKKSPLFGPDSLSKSYLFSISDF